MYKLKLVNNNAVAYISREEATGKELTQEHKDKLKEAQKFSGKLSSHSKRKIRNYLKVWHESIRVFNRYSKKTKTGKKKKLVFITLTLSGEQAHTDEYIKKNMLGRLLEEWKKAGTIIHYLWKAEKQKNGRIHFHVIVDRFIFKDNIQQYWNAIQKKHGYIDDFKKKHGHENPPSTQVQVAPDSGQAFDYVAKYQEKTEDGDTVSGRLWSCDFDLSRLKPYVTDCDGVINSILNKAAENNNTYIYNSDFFTFYSTRNLLSYFFGNEEFKRDYINHYISIYVYIYNADAQDDTLWAQGQNSFSSSHEANEKRKEAGTGKATEQKLGLSEQVRPLYDKKKFFH